MQIVRNGVIAKPETKEWDYFLKTQRLTQKQLQEAKKAFDELQRNFPAYVNCPDNNLVLADYMYSRNQLPTVRNVVEAYCELAPTGKLFIDPSRCNIFRHGEDGIQGHACQSLSADEIKAITTPYRPKREADMTATEYFDAHPELAAERHKHTRAAVERDRVRKAEAEVQRFLLTRANYQPSDENKNLLIGYLRENNLPLTAEALVQAFEALKSRLDLADRDVSSGPVRVVEYGPEESVTSLQRKVARMNLSEYAQFCIDHPELVAIIDE